MSFEPIIVTDGDRRIEVKQLSALEKMRVFKALPKGSEDKLYYVSMAFIAASVRKIDDLQLLFPKDESGFEHIIGKLGDSGVEAVQSALAPQASDDARTVEEVAGN